MFLLIANCVENYLPSVKIAFAYEYVGTAQGVSLHVCVCELIKQ